jgi:integrase
MQLPPKPYPAFPLFASKNGQWRKDVRIGGKVRPFYFGPWATDPQGKAAVAEWLAREPAIRAGLDHVATAAKVAPGGLTIGEVFRRFLADKQAEYEAGRLSGPMLDDYIRELNKFGAWVGADAKVDALLPEHFAGYRRHIETTRKLGVDRLATTIKLVKAAFNHAGPDGMGWCKQVSFGAGFRQPATDPDSKAAARLRAGDTAEDLPIYTGQQIDWLIDHAPSPVVKAAILMGINCGVGPSDLARMQWAHVVKGGRKLQMRRGKTGIRREGYLWLRTREALEALRSLPHQAAAIAREGDKARMFLNERGKPLVDQHETRDAAGKVKAVKNTASFAARFGRLVAAAKLAGVIPAGHKLSFYNLRHTFYTHAENTERETTVKRTMGHALKGEGKKYDRKAMPLRRLKFVALYVKARMWPKPKTPKGQGSTVTPGKLRIAG